VEQRAVVEEQLDMLDYTMGLADLTPDCTMGLADPMLALHKMFAPLLAAVVV